ncbi:RNA polymerase sigma factor [Desulfuribacillus alkaliarsenatis]|uniref:RNA polymerase sigma factor 70 region 4 type 2 domain-containing protein n=1 Tax=Desulfuribacillus alkaliarsenatis TaxID=766136 RepID=A0A1E5G326_9FIRM|nr:sigma factor-like helix-turn-helix DNA-binding protein [Desulfuribacillus alkaliarsenatis]OEF97441.1 hypothetical protein BHF68_04320 [Desulfuribacillus alkaliarsenatis]
MGASNINTITFKKALTLYNNLLSEGTPKYKANILSVYYSIEPIGNKILELYYKNEMSYDEIAYTLGMNVTDVRSHMYKARRICKELRKLLEV